MNHLRHRPTGRRPGVRDLALLLGVLGLLGAARAADDDRPLRPGEVTERGLVEALAPAPLPAAGGQASDYARGFRPAPAPVAPRRQSILMTFDTDSAELLPATRAVLDIVAKALVSDRLAGVDIAIEGHADPRGDEAHNLRLSQARAESVVAYLVQRHGIPAQRLEPVGKGSSELLNRAVPTAAENRRVSIVTRGR